MELLGGFYAGIRDFLETGGWVLWLLGGVIFLMWALVVERVLYQRVVFPRQLEEAARAWAARAERGSWRARQIRKQLVSELGLRLQGPFPLIRTLLALCPLVGLLGTVTGMIEVFDVMAMVGTGNPRSMASGVYRAIIPAMSGMVAALSGVFAIAYLQRNTRQLRIVLEDRLAAD